MNDPNLRKAEMVVKAINDFAEGESCVHLLEWVKCVLFDKLKETHDYDDPVECFQEYLANIHDARVDEIEDLKNEIEDKEEKNRALKELIDELN